MRIIQICKIKVVINANYVDEVQCKVRLLDIYGVMFGNPYVCIRDIDVW